MLKPLLTKANVSELLGLHPASIMRLVHQNRFPKPIHTSGTARGRARWRPEDVQAWLASHVA
jgi:predicted DNA-binding transcriptional regulator AlpA